ncbi:MAG: hypothetical protein ACWGMY_02310 [Hyphomicrobiaceae bacterium]
MPHEQEHGVEGGEADEAPGDTAPGLGRKRGAKAHVVQLEDEDERGQGESYLGELAARDDDLQPFAERSGTWTLTSTSPELTHREWALSHQAGTDRANLEDNGGKLTREFTNW